MPHTPAPPWTKSGAQLVDEIETYADGHLAGKPLPTPGAPEDGMVPIYDHSGAAILWVDPGTEVDDDAITLAKLNSTVKPTTSGGTAAPTDPAVRVLGTGSTQAAAGNDSRFPTTGQKNALAGTAGTPGTGNEYVTTSDGRVPSSGEKSALGGTSGTPGSGNKYVTDADGRLPTTGQKNALAGTTGTPGTGNEYVTTSDTRVPTAGEKSALAGTAGTPGSSNKYVTDSDTRLLKVVREFINPMDPKYGCVGDGTTDDSGTLAGAGSGWLKAVDDWNTSGGELVLPPGKVFYLNPGSATACAKVAPTTGGKKRTFRAFGGSYFKVSANMPSPMQVGRTADNQTWDEIDWWNYSVDRNSVASGENILFGAQDAAGGFATLGQRNNYGRLRFFYPKFWNAPANGNGGIPVGGIGLWVRHVYTNEGDLNWDPHTGTQNTVQDILVVRPEFDGGDYGFICAANLQRGETVGLRIKNYSGTTVNWVAYNSDGSPRVAAQPALQANDWIHIGTGKYFERRQVSAVTDNGDGTGSITINSALSFSHPTEDATGAGKGSQMAMGSTCNVWFDRIHVDGQGGHIASSTNGYSSNILLVGHGIGGHDHSVSDITLSNSNDNALEVDTALGFTARKVHTIDSVNEGFLSRNFNVPQNQQNHNPQDLQQHHEYIDCVNESRTVNPSAGGWIAGYNWRSGFVDGPSPIFGTVKTRNCFVIDRTANFRTGNFSKALGAGVDSSIRRIEGDISYMKFNMSDSSATAPRIVVLRPNTDCTIDLKVVAHVSGTAGSSYQCTVIEVGATNPVAGGLQSDLNVNLDAQLRSQVASAPSGSHHLIDFGVAAGSAFLGNHHGRLSGHLLEAFTSSDSAPKGAVFTSSMADARVNGLILLDDWDTARVAGAQPFVFPSSATFLRKLLFGPNNNVAGTVVSHALPNVTANYTATIANRFLPVDATAGNVTITLPAVTALPLRHTLIVKKVDASVNTVTLDGNASETIDGATTKVLSTQYDKVAIVNTGAAWLIA